MSAHRDPYQCVNLQTDSQSVDGRGSQTDNLIIPPLLGLSGMMENAAGETFTKGN